MERNYDEVIADMLIQLVRIEQSLEKQNTRMEAFDKRMNLTIRRMVKAESRLEASENRMKLVDEKLEQSIKDQMEFSEMQSQVNMYFLDYINNNNQK